jgi:hypothetical protein
MIGRREAGEMNWGITVQSVRNCGGQKEILRMGGSFRLWCKFRSAISCNMCWCWEAVWWGCPGQPKMSIYETDSKINIRHGKKPNIVVETELGNLWTLQSNALKITVITQRNKIYLIIFYYFI